MPVDVVICAAAVSDYKPKFRFKEKIKKNTNFEKSISFTKNPDILAYLGKTNKDRPKLVVGFSAETKNLVKNSEKKIKDKYCDLLIANDVSKNDVGFNSNFNEVYIIDKDGGKRKIKKSKKSYIASIIVESIFNKLMDNGKTIN